MLPEKDRLYMSRCLQLARKGAGKVSTNPMVGCVIVHDGRIIGEGWHRRFGEAHAEVNAIRSVRPEDETLFPDSTLYVNLEPCSHFGKTPPCSDLIIEKGIGKVVVGMQDPFAQVNGRGIRKLRDAGIEVTVGVLEKECRELNRRFCCFHGKQRPYVILKWAETTDGFIDNDRDPQVTPPTWMTGAACQILVHRWRSEEKAIMAGVNTLLRDDPALTVRRWHGADPLRVTIDNHDRLTGRERFFADGEGRFAPNYRIYRGATLPEILTDLHAGGIASLFVEGGAKVLQSFIDGGLWDEARRFVTPLRLKDLNGSQYGEGVKAPLLKGGETVLRKKIGDAELSVLRRYEH